MEPESGPDRECVKMPCVKKQLVRGSRGERSGRTKHGKLSRAGSHCVLSQAAKPSSVRWSSSQFGDHAHFTPVILIQREGSDGSGVAGFVDDEWNCRSELRCLVMRCATVAKASPVSAHSLLFAC